MSAAANNDTSTPSSRRRPRPDADAAANAAAAADDAANAKQARVSHPFQVEEDDLKCAVCMEFPDAKIFQCPNGHLLCDECHERVIEAYQCVCPTCRAKLSRDRPSRNRFAESVLATIVVPCPNAGCGERLAFGKVRAHAVDACAFRIVSCKFAPLGCDWKDIQSKLKGHERDCSLRQKSAKSILKRVLERSAQQKAEERRSKQEMQSQLKIAELLSSRCRDIIIREVVIERDTICDVIASKPFKAFGATLCLELETGSARSSSASSPIGGDSNAGHDAPAAASAAAAATADNTSSSNGAFLNNNNSSANNDPTEANGSSSNVGAGEKSVGLVLTQRSRRAKRLRLTAFLLKGPDSEIANFIPVVQQVQFSRSRRSSGMFALPLSEAQAKDMFEMGSLTVRIGLIDRRRGLSRSFSNEAAARGGDDDDSDSYSSSSDDDGIVSQDPDLHYYSTSSDDEDCIHTYLEDDDHGDEITIY